MTIRVDDIGEIQKALNDAAGKASLLWTTFITFELYLAIAFGSVTHRDLFLESPIRLPVLNVELPLVAFFAVAPTILVIFHFYVFLQLFALARKAKAYDALLTKGLPNDDEGRQYVRQRLDSFLVLQFLVGPKEQRIGFNGFWLRLIAWITLVGAPVLILLEAQVTFLPYHHEPVVWLQRLAVVICLIVVWYYWEQIRSEDAPFLPHISDRAWEMVGAAASLGVVFFSVCLATFPGEWADERMPAGPVPSTAWGDPAKGKRAGLHIERWTSLRELVFSGPIDQVSGKPASLFSNRLVLTDQTLVDGDKLDKGDFSRSFRKRDLRQAVLDRADLRKADFTGAMLDGVSAVGTKFQSARFGCLDLKNGFGCTSLQGAHLKSANMRSARLGGARLQGADLNEAELQDADLEAAQMQGAKLRFAYLQGANLFRADLRGADMHRAWLFGAHLPVARLDGANLLEARMHGADLSGASLRGATLTHAYLRGATLERAQMEGTDLTGVDLTGASLAGASVWRTHGSPDLDLVELDKINTAGPASDFANAAAFAAWRDGLLDGVPTRAAREMIRKGISTLDSSTSTESRGFINWEERAKAQGNAHDRERKLALFLADLACSGDLSPYMVEGAPRSMPYVARGLLKSRIGSTQILTIERLAKGKSEEVVCPGVKGFTADDWHYLERLARPSRKKN